MKLNQLSLQVALLLLLPLVLGAQSLDFYYSPSRGTVVIDYNYHCDPCFFGQEIAAICACEKECEETFDACEATCREMHHDLLDFQLCLDECTTTYNACKASCGFRPRKVKAFSHFNLAIDSYWAPIGQNPYFNRQSVQGTSYTGYHLGDLETFRWRPPLPPWPEVYFTHNTCFILELTIYFTDGTKCTRLESFFTNYG